jgi:CO/xanthine dehydrogenase FAD-binding subunit
MKAANFDYVLAHSLEEVCALLAEHGPDAKLIAGGQSLVPMLAMRLTKPAVLIDLNDVDTLKGIELDADSVTIGAGTRHHQLESHPQLGARMPLMRQALHWVGHPQTRNRGTLGGSLVHADPSAELPLLCTILNGQIVVASSDSEDSFDAPDFFLAPMVAALEPQQCVTKVVLPLWTGFTGSSFHEVSPRRGDFALVSAAAQIELDAAGGCVRAAAGVGGVGGAPARASVVEEALAGMTAPALSEASVTELARQIADELDPDDDLHATAQYRREVACVLLARAICGALGAARARIQQTGRSGGPA